MIRIFIFVLLWFVTAGASTPFLAPSREFESRSALQEQDWASALPQDEGKELVLKLCTTCHGLDVIAMQRKSRDDWKRTVQNMRDKEEALIFGDDAVTIVNYLVQHRGPADKAANRSASVPASLSEEQAASGGTAPLPNDVQQETRNRLPLVQRQDLDEFGKKLFDSYQGEGERSGPREIRLHSPRVAEYMTLGNQYLRYNTGIDLRLMELVTLLAARATDQQFEWTGHESVALKAGLSQEIIDVVRYNKPVPSTFDERDSTLIALCREVLEKNKVSSETFARALKLFGAKGVVDIVSHLGHKVATAILLNAFDQRLRPGQQPLLPIPVP